MTNLLTRVIRRNSITTLDDYVSALNTFLFQGNVYGFPQVQQTLSGDRAERPGADLISYARHAYHNNGIVFACMAVRALVFSSVRIAYQQMRQGRPGDLFGTFALDIFETPWPGGTTQDMLALMIQDADLAGNSYWARSGNELVRLRPDWVQIVFERRADGLGHRKVGYLYHDGGIGATRTPTVLLLNEVAHFMPTPDPDEPYKGMSWLRTVFDEIAGDRLMNRHKLKFFVHGATPNMVVKFDRETSQDAFDDFVEKFQAGHEGAQNAGKTLFLAGGADVEVVGRDFQQVDFKKIQGHAETRIAAAAGVHPVIVGLSEGLAGSSLNAGNYGQARRRFADGTMHPLWQNMAGSLQPLVPILRSARLWYDARDVPFLRDDEADLADIRNKDALTLEVLVRGGYDPDAAVEFVLSGDPRRLVGNHSGLFSVQLQPPGTVAPELPAGDDEPPTGEDDD